MTTIRHIAVVRILQLEQYIKSKKYLNTFQHYTIIFRVAKLCFTIFRTTVFITNEYQKLEQCDI